MYHQRGLSVLLFSNFLSPFYLIWLFVVLELNSEPGHAEQESSCWAAYSLWEHWCRAYILTGDYVLSSGQSRESRGWWWSTVIYAYLCLYEQIYEVSVVLEFIGQKLGKKTSKKVPYMDNNESWETRLPRSASPETCCSCLPCFHTCA